MGIMVMNQYLTLKIPLLLQVMLAQPGKQNLIVVLMWWMITWNRKKFSMPPMVIKRMSPSSMPPMVKQLVQEIILLWTWFPTRIQLEHCGCVTGVWMP